MPDVPLTREATAAARPCSLYADHGSARPSRTQGHHVFPVYLQNRTHGRIVDGELRWLCGTCHDNVHEWLAWLVGEARAPDPTPPPRARALAEVARDRYVAAGGVLG